jgi:hypothetical protein
MIDIHRECWVLRLGLCIKHHSYLQLSQPLHRVGMYRNFIGTNTLSRPLVPSVCIAAFVKRTRDSWILDIVLLELRGCFRGRHGGLPGLPELSLLSAAKG